MKLSYPRGLGTSAGEHKWHSDDIIYIIRPLVYRRYEITMYKSYNHIL